MLHETILTRFLSFDMLHDTKIDIGEVAFYVQYMYQWDITFIYLKYNRHTTIILHSNIDRRYSCTHTIYVPNNIIFIFTSNLQSLLIHVE